MLKLRDFGEALSRELEKASYSVANFAKHTGGISKDDVRDFKAGKKAPDKVTTKKIVHCFPILMAYEHDLRTGNYEAPPQRSEVRQIKPKHTPAREPTRLDSPPRKLLAPQSYKPKLEIVRQNPLPPVLLAQPLAVPLTQALRKTRAEMLTELAGMVKKRLGNHTAEDHDFTIKNDGKGLVVKLQLAEGHEGDSVDSGCYLTVGPREPAALAVFCKTMTNGNYCDNLPRVQGIKELLEIAQLLHDAVKDRRFE